MSNNKIGNSIKLRKNPNDRIFTPKPLAVDMIRLCEIKAGERVLDPSKGEGVFYDNLPTECKADWCEIEEGKDFFSYDKEVDVIVGNPPYSLWNKWIEKTLELNPQRFCYIFGAMNLTPERIDRIHKAGYGVRKIKFARVYWWFSYSIIVLFEKGVESSVLTEPITFDCDICGTRCGRGRIRKGKKNGMNECGKS